MEEMKLDKPIEMSLEQFECPNCKKKIYINKEDIKDTLDCPFCDITGIKNIRVFEISIHKIFEK